jgi:hypothetical protein
MDNIKIVFLGMSAEANGIVAVIALTAVLLALVLSEPLKKLWRPISEYLWHWFNNDRTKTMPVVAKEETPLSPAEPTSMGSSHGSRAAAPCRQSYELPNLKLGGGDRKASGPRQAAADEVGKAKAG